MPVKQIPSVGEAFLGSDPFVPKILKVTFGSSGYTQAVPDVNLATTEGGVNLVTFADTGFFITDLAVRIVEIFSVAGLGIGPDSSDRLWFDDFDTNLFSAGTLNAGLLENLAGVASTGAGAIAGSDFGLQSSSLFPPGSDAAIQFTYSAAATLGTEGYIEMFVYYHEIP